jgi:hypothetical protein
MNQQFELEKYKAEQRGRERAEDREWKQKERARVREGKEKRKADKAEAHRAKMEYKLKMKELEIKAIEAGRCEFPSNK